MLIKVKLDEFWLHEEDDLESGLRKYITNDVVAQIQKSIKDQVDEQITKKVTEVINEKIAQVIDTTITELVASGTITQGSGVNAKEVKITDYIKSLFRTDRGWGSVSTQVENYAKKFCADVKVQYNAVFANHIVQGLKENGMLKDEVVQMLLEKK